MHSQHKKYFENVEYFVEIFFIYVTFNRGKLHVWDTALVKNPCAQIAFYSIIKENHTTKFRFMPKAKCEIWVKIRVPGSLSDRWSSLTTIYPLRFHEIFGRWLSYNIKRVFQQKRKKRCILTGFLYRFLCKSKGKENSYRKEHNSLHIFHVICLTYIMPTKLLNIGIINWPDKYIGSSTAKLK